MYRREAISNLKSGNYGGATGALYAYNSLLPKEYQVTISNHEYKEKTKEDITAICNSCLKAIDYTKIKIHEVLSPFLEFVVSGKSQDKIWNCPDCKNNNKLITTKLVQNILQEPYHLQVIYKQPKRRDGLIDNKKFVKLYNEWFWTFLTELEAQAARFRDENWNKGESVFDDPDVDTVGEEDAD